MTVDDLLAAARARLDRLEPRQAARAITEGALLIDIRPERQRKAEGDIPAATVIERNVLEWRLDPASQWRLPAVRNHSVRAIIICSEGYTSSLAAASLLDLGLSAATDVVGGYVAWRDAGLPTRCP